MGSNLVIVAIPDENDRVWKVSSEKIPHLTVLFLDETKNVSNLEQILLFVEHAASTTLNRFYLPVDRRGELGTDKADVLFFKKARYDFKAISEFRDTLLQDPNIKTAYDSATQFEGPWNPHLTLGYPTTPAKSIQDDAPFYDVSFNKIAVWTGDFDGPDFLLKDYWDEMNDLAIPMDVAMSNLEHHGVKGQKWGVRKESIVGTAKKAGKAVASVGRFVGDVGFEANLESDTGRHQINSDISSKAHAAFKRTDLPAINAKPEHVKASKLKNRLLHPLDPGTKAYRKEVKAAYIQRLEAAANSMTNVSGTRQYTIRERGWELPAGGGALPKSKNFWEVSSREIAHADGEVVETVEVIMDKDGFIIDLKSVDNSLAQTADLGAEFLSHYGKKGMKWGVRNVDSSGRTTETKRVGIQKFLDPQGHDLSTDAAKTVIGTLIPIVAPLTVPAQIRLVRGGARGLKARSVHKQEQKFEKHANTAKNFVEIHNGAQDQINKHVAEVNKKYPQDLTKDPKAQKQYDSEITKGLQDAYRTSANQLGNKTGTRHLDLEFHNDGLDFKIVAKEGMQTPTLEKVVHAAANNTSVEFTGKIKRDATGHLVGLVFDDFEPKSMAQTVDLGAEFLEHYGIRGMHWGVRKAAAVTTQSHIDSGIVRRQTKIQTKGGEAHPPTHDAIKAAVNKQKLKKSGMAALSNQDLKDLQTRLQLETQVQQLTSSKGKRAVQKTLEEEGKQQLSRGVRKSTPYAFKKARKGAATVATTAALAL